MTHHENSAFGPNKKTASMLRAMADELEKGTTQFNSVAINHFLNIEEMGMVVDARYTGHTVIISTRAMPPDVQQAVERFFDYRAPVFFYPRQDNREAMRLIEEMRNGPIRLPMSGPAEPPTYCGCTISDQPPAKDEHFYSGPSLCYVAKCLLHGDRDGARWWMAKELGAVGPVVNIDPASLRLFCRAPLSPGGEAVLGIAYKPKPVRERDIAAPTDPTTLKVGDTIQTVMGPGRLLAAIRQGDEHALVKLLPASEFTTGQAAYQQVSHEVKEQILQEAMEAIYGAPDVWPLPLPAEVVNAPDGRSYNEVEAQADFFKQAILKT